MRAWQMASSSDLQYAEMLSRARARDSFFAIIDVFLVVLSIFTSLGYWALLLIIGPLYGYYGARSLNAMKVAVYLGFKFFHCFLYFVAFFEASAAGEVIWALILVFCELYITFQVYKFYKMLRSLDEEALVRAMQQLQMQQGGFHYHHGGAQYGRHHAGFY